MYARGKKYDKHNNLVFEGKIINGKRNGLVKEYDYNYNLFLLFNITKNIKIYNFKYNLFFQKTIFKHDFIKLIIFIR